MTPKPATLFSRRPKLVDIQGKTVEMQDANFAYGGVAASYIIYDFGRREARIRQARAQSSATLSTFEARRTDVFLRVIEAYFGILETGKLVIAAQEEIAQMEQHRRVAQALFEEGVVTRNDILQADVRLAAARQNLLVTNNRLDNIWLQLNYLTGFRPVVPLRTDRAEFSVGNGRYAGR